MKQFSEIDLDRLNERVCNTVCDGHSLSENTISDLLDAIKCLRAERQYQQNLQKRHVYGMRPEIAARAMQGLLAGNTVKVAGGDWGARAAVEAADALIAELLK